MPRVTGPMISLAAHGSLANVLSFRRTTRGTTLERKPRSPAPTTSWPEAMKHFMKAAATTYIAASPTLQAPWETIGNATKITGRNAFTREALRYFRRNLSRHLQPTHSASQQISNPGQGTCGYDRGRLAVTCADMDSENGYGLLARISTVTRAAFDLQDIRAYAWYSGSGGFNGLIGEGIVLPVYTMLYFAATDSNLYQITAEQYFT